MKLFRTKMIYFIDDLIKTVEDGTTMSILTLFHNEYIRSGYIDKVKNIFKKKPEFFYLNENVILLNIKPELGFCLKNGISLVFFRNPLDNSNDNYKIHFIIGLSVIDDENYFLYKQKIQKIFNNRNTLKKLIEQNSLKNLIKIIEEIDI